ncbi:MAG TPA: methylated-DNA--[protein]-cysteine S-methyltransferase [Pirellulales bacterium]
MKTRTNARQLIFPSALGWMLLGVDGKHVCQLSFGHASPLAAQADALVMDAEVEVDGDFGRWAPLVERLQRYGEGAYDDFLDVELAPVAKTPFQRRVIELCRHIPYGSSLTYGELAARAGHPRAARAVGTCMRTNSTPLVVPCHRVVGAGGSLRGYSAGEGTRMKLRLLEMEAAGCASSR